VKKSGVKLTCCLLVPSLELEQVSLTPHPTLGYLDIATLPLLKAGGEDIDPVPKKKWCPRCVV